MSAPIILEAFMHHIPAAVVLCICSSIMVLGSPNHARAQNPVKLIASDGLGDDFFGASVSISGDTAIIGAYRAINSSGSAYIFTHNGSTWTQQAKLTASDASPNNPDLFGFSVSIDGDIAIVGARNDDSPATDKGSAYIFTRTGTTWTQQAKLTASDGTLGDLFGVSVSISGGTAIIGAIGNDDAGSSSGSAYIFTRTGSSWTQQAKLTASDAAQADLFGNSVAISGNTTIVGANLNDALFINAGAAYIFTRTGSTWTQQAKLTASDTAQADSFGNPVAISGDNAIIGATGNDDAGSSSGSAYIFTRASSSWTQQANLTASDAAPGDQFGNSVSVSGETAVVGVKLDDDAGDSSGSAYIFTRTGSSWTQQAKLTAPDALPFDLFGSAVSIWGNTTIIGAANGGASREGSAYVLEIQCTADLTGDGTVDGADLGILLGNWGSPGTSDLNGNGITDGLDLGILLGAWGPCP